MSDYKYISLIEVPTLKEKAAEWFHSKWGIPKEAYLKCMEAFLNGETDYGWFLCLDENKIVAGLGVIDKIRCFIFILDYDSILQPYM